MHQVPVWSVNLDAVKTGRRGQRQDAPQPPVRAVPDQGVAPQTADRDHHQNAGEQESERRHRKIGGHQHEAIEDHLVRYAENHDEPRAATTFPSMPR